MKSKLTAWFKALAGTLEYRFRPWNYSGDELIVLCMHSTPIHLMPAFHELLTFVQKHFTVLSPKDLSAYYKGELSGGPYVVFTFDDGLKNNMYVANALHEQGLGAFFFIVPDFVTAPNPEAYYRAFIRRQTKPVFDRLAEDVMPMNEHELRQLVQMGHEPGSHSMTHSMRATDDDAKTGQEVIESKQALALLSHAAIRSYCSPVNTNLSVNPLAKRLIGEHYDFHFTTFPGLNAEQKNPQYIYRRNVELDWSQGMIKYALGRADLRRWMGEILRFQQL